MIARSGKASRYLLVQCEEAEAVALGVGSDQEVGENAPQAGVALLPTAGSIGLKGSPG